ncbi:MAG: hypothetical protein H6564_08125 [Lewinellaceae bacterium]|nr:hypothetical protein [Lewinellaceae bacterium]
MKKRKRAGFFKQLFVVSHPFFAVFSPKKMPKKNLATLSGSQKSDFARFSAGISGKPEALLQMFGKRE